MVLSGFRELCEIQGVKHWRGFESNCVVVSIGHSMRKGEGIEAEMMGVDDASQFCTAMLQGLYVVIPVLQGTLESRNLGVLRVQLALQRRNKFVD